MRKLRLGLPWVITNLHLLFYNVIYLIGENVNMTFMMNRTAMHSAVAKTNLQIVEALLKYAPDLLVIKPVLFKFHFI